MIEQEQNNLIKLKHVEKVYATGGGPFTALKNINLDIQKGEFLGISGKSGAGKTTLLNMISGVSQISSGEILYLPKNTNGRTQDIQEISIHKLNEDELAVWRGQNLGIVYQSFELIPTLNLIKNVMLPQDFAGSYRPLISKEKALELLDLVDIAEHAYKIPAHISGGQKQRVAIARALINDPAIIIADEPTGNLDSVTAEHIIQIFENLVDYGKTIVMVTHDESFAPRFTRRLEIVDGELGEPSNQRQANRKAIDLSSFDADEETRSAVLEEEQDMSPQTHPPVTALGKIIAPTTTIFQEPAAIQLYDVQKIYENAAGKFTALKNINLQIDYGQFISIVGKSGSGKSTLINMITGIDFPTGGEVAVGGEKIYQLSESQRALWRGKNIGVVFQFFQLLPILTLLENTMLPMDYCKLYSISERPKRAMQLLEQVGLKEQAHKLPASVSSGQQQSAAIARALANDPSIILADEPTGNLDSKSADMILTLFEKLAADGKTILIVTHDKSITKRTNQTVTLSDGEIIDPTIARALPLLTHPQMLAATHTAQRKFYAAHAMIIKQGDPVRNFYMIVEGEVEIVMKSDTCAEMSLARLGAGQFFGEIELTKDQPSIASVRASSSGAEVALISKEEFYQIIDGSTLTRKALHTVAGMRAKENKMRRKTDC